MQTPQLSSSNRGDALINISKKDGKTTVNEKATILASIPTSNGIIHVIDEVLLPE